LPAVWSQLLLRLIPLLLHQVGLSTEGVAWHRVVEHGAARWLEGRRRPRLPQLTYPVHKPAAWCMELSAARCTVLGIARLRWMMPELGRAGEHELEHEHELPCQ
jgi:hypothetical protein